MIGVLGHESAGDNLGLWDEFLYDGVGEAGGELESRWQVARYKKSPVL